jgi:hypothetical protein
MRILGPKLANWTLAAYDQQTCFVILLIVTLRGSYLVDQPARSITPKSRYCGSWLRYENPDAAKAALRFSRLARNHNSFDLIQRNLRFGPLVLCGELRTPEREFSV